MKRVKSAEVLATHTRQLFTHAVERAAALLRAGEVVALPTETVYGLAANALNAEAVARIFEIKGRPSHNPIIVHVASLEMARECVGDWPELAIKLARAFWPGPLTMVLPRSKQIPDIVTASGATVGVRWPSHPFIQSVIQACGFPLAAPSANRSNNLSPTNSDHVFKSLGGRIPLIVDGGQSQIGIESTVIDLTVDPPCVLRPGMIHDIALMAVTGSLSGSSTANERLLKSPGLLQKHYSPKAKVAVLAWSNDSELLAETERLNVADQKIHILAHTHIPSTFEFGRVSVIPHDAEAFARAFYAELHQCDEEGAQIIVVEKLPETSEWSGIADRLKRAAATEF